MSRLVTPQEGAFCVHHFISCLEFRADSEKAEKMTELNFHGNAKGAA
jgi:hypothetical protein